MKQVAIIGAGIAGLVCARELKKFKYKVTLFEKSRSLGGRCATRKWNSHIVDHGLQYFTLSNEEIHKNVKYLCYSRIGLLDKAIVDLQGAEWQPDEKKYYHLDGNNRIGKALAQGLDIRMESPITTLQPITSKWRVNDHSFDYVVSSVPFPQLNNFIPLEPSLQIRFEPCLTALFSYEGLPQNMSADIYGIIDTSNTSIISWSACENHKTNRIPLDETVFVVHASEKFSREYLETSSDAYLPHLQRELENTWQLSPTKQKNSFSHRWRFARSTDPYSLPNAQLPENFFVCGDSIVKSRFEDVWLSGLQAAYLLIAKDQQTEIPFVDKQIITT
ncbi:MAG: FAD-dependent oxidoreductase [Verrucomicrobiota bacterium]